jgi:Photosynthetic reaction centre cytochrome C subunit
MIVVTRLLRAACLASFLAAPFLYAQQPAAPANPAEPRKFKDLQLLKDLSEEEVGMTMRYFAASTGRTCSNCHQLDPATGRLDFAAKTDAKKTSREMIKIVQTVNAGGEEFGKVKINCGTCHQGQGRPAGLQQATMMTTDQMVQANTMQTMMALRAANPPAPGGPGGPGGGGRNGPPPGPPAAEVLKKYADALGSAAATLQSRELTGIVTTRTAQVVPFSIKQKGSMYLETIQSVPAGQTIGFDGKAGWSKSGERVNDLVAFPLHSALRGADMLLATDIAAKYPTLESTKRAQFTLAQGGIPFDAIILRGTSGTTTEQFFFDEATGLLMRRVTRTDVPLNGALVETTDYTQYRAENGVMTPHKIIRSNWNTYDTFAISKVVINGTVDDAAFHKP